MTSCGGEALSIPSELAMSGRRRRRRVTSRFWLIIGLIVFVYAIGSYTKGFIEIWRLRQQIVAVELEIANAQTRNQQLREELAYLQSDEYIEKVAREELGLILPGETPVILTTPTDR